MLTKTSCTCFPLVESLKLPWTLNWYHFESRAKFICKLRIASLSRPRNTCQKLGRLVCIQPALFIKSCCLYKECRSSSLLLLSWGHSVASLTLSVELHACLSVSALKKVRQCHDPWFLVCQILQDLRLKLFLDSLWGHLCLVNLHVENVLAEGWQWLVLFDQSTVILLLSATHLLMTCCALQLLFYLFWHDNLLQIIVKVVVMGYKLPISALISWMLFHLFMC